MNMPLSIISRFACLGETKGADGFSGSPWDHRMHNGVFVDMYQVATLGSVSAAGPSGGNGEILRVAGC